jgi:hypothetical protein
MGEAIRQKTKPALTQAIAKATIEGHKEDKGQCIRRHQPCHRIRLDHKAIAYGWQRNPKHRQVQHRHSHRHHQPNQDCTKIQTRHRLNLGSGCSRPKSNLHSIYRPTIIHDTPIESTIT